MYEGCRWFYYLEDGMGKVVSHLDLKMLFYWVWQLRWMRITEFDVLLLSYSFCPSPPSLALSLSLSLSLSLCLSVCLSLSLSLSVSLYLSLSLLLSSSLSLCSFILISSVCLSELKSCGEITDFILSFEKTLKLFWEFIDIQYSAYQMPNSMCPGTPSSVDVRVKWIWQWYAIESIKTSARSPSSAGCLTVKRQSLVHLERSAIRGFASVENMLESLIQIG